MRAVAWGVLCACALARPAFADAALTESLVVSGRATDLTGLAVSSNEGSISAADNRLMPILLLCITRTSSSNASSLRKRPRLAQRHPQAIELLVLQSINLLLFEGRMQNNIGKNLQGRLSLVRHHDNRRPARFPVCSRIDRSA